MSDDESHVEEVVLKEDTKPTASPQMVTKSELDEIVEGWKTKFHQLSEGVRAIKMATEKFHSHMDSLQRDSCARDGAQERRIIQMQEGLTCFLEKCDPTHLAAEHYFDSPCAPMMSTPMTNRPDFHLASPVNQSAEPTRGNDLNQRPAHEDEHSGEAQHSPSRNNSSEMNSSASRPSSSPKVPIFDGTVSAQFRPWIIQFEAIARHQCWTMGERVVQLVASLTGPASNMLIGMTMGQLDDYAFLVARLSRRYDPPKCEETHHAELRACTRRRNETADEFAENLKNLAIRGHCVPSMLDNGRESCPTSSFPDRPSIEHANRDDHGTTG